jgi:hypothetical protein
MFNIQRRMADWHLARAESWTELVAAHDEWVTNYNEQGHCPHSAPFSGFLSIFFLTRALWMIYLQKRVFDYHECSV